MGNTYLHGHGTRQTPQSEPIPGSKQVANNAGGFSFAVDKWTRLERFLILGSEGGTYYVGEQKLTMQNVAMVRDCLTEDYIRTIQTIVDISSAGRNIKQEPVIFALAVAAADPQENARQFALAKLPDVCRTATHLFMFASFVQEQRGWGRSLRRAVGEWYAQDPAKLAYQMAKYRDRHGFTHADLLRLAHPAKHVSAGNPEIDTLTDHHHALYAWAKDRSSVKVAGDENPLRVVEAFERAQAAEAPKVTAGLIGEYGGLLSREMLRSEHLTDADVNRALLEQGMPMTALIRNLGNLTRHGVLAPMGEHTRRVVEQITNPESLKAARVHPFTVLQALATYQQGHGFRGTSTWTPVQEIVNALDSAFYMAFDNVEPTNKRYMLGIDVSGSMTFPVANSAVTCAMGAAAMAMVTDKVEPFTAVRGFSGDFVDLNISSYQRLDDIVAQTSRMTFGSTDCSLPMLWALKNNIEADVFCVYTDNETWAGTPHPVQALREYREKTGIPAKLVVCGMTATDVSIADPDDGGMLDVVGFDSSAPQVISEFAMA